jgi:hypothetical protein
LLQSILRAAFGLAQRRSVFKRFGRLSGGTTKLPDQPTAGTATNKRRRLNKFL